MMGFPAALKSQYSAVIYAEIKLAALVVFHRVRIDAISI